MIPDYFHWKREKVLEKQKKKHTTLSVTAQSWGRSTSFANCVRLAVDHELAPDFVEVSNFHAIADVTAAVMGTYVV